MRNSYYLTLLFVAILLTLINFMEYDNRKPEHVNNTIIQLTEKNKLLSAKIHDGKINEQNLIIEIGQINNEYIQLKRNYLKLHYQMKLCDCLHKKIVF
jgi:hypothetical protein